MKIKSEFSYFIYFALLNVCFISCDKTPLSVDCDFTEPDDIEILSSSLDTAAYYTSDSVLLFLDSSSDSIVFSASNYDRGIVCLHEWVCADDESITETFWARRPVKNKTISSPASPYTLEIDHYATFNEGNPESYSDYLNIKLKYGDEHSCSILSIILNPRTAQVDNDDLNFISQITLDSIDFYDVYESTSDGFQIYYSMDLGLIYLKDIANDYTLLRTL